jgi:hypothetical protein
MLKMRSSMFLYFKMHKKIFKNPLNPYWKENSENGDWHFVRRQAGLIIIKSSRVIDRLLKENKFGLVSLISQKVFSFSIIVALFLIIEKQTVKIIVNYTA